MVMGLINANPVIHEKKERRVRQAPETTDENAVEPIDQLEIFDILLYDFPNMNVVNLIFLLYHVSEVLCSRRFVLSLTFLHHIRDIKDPEHPYSLEQLNVVTEDSIELNDESNHVRVTFTPTVEHCSMATVIGLCIRVKLIRSLPPRYKVDIRVAPGSHSTEAAVNKQLNDKERVAAALENPNLLDMVEECLSPTFD
ncbi:protein AE7 isoform X1 [Setaria italica]|uniref:protein AE7 isoform X1 n=1 Tax=Setaria italica TaxID=4555 RepID=UPI000BE4B5D5|nr:protein AE7 isoform X1 [Setaria italica]